MKTRKIGIFVGSLRRDSFSRSIAKAVAALAQEDFEFGFIDIGKLPLYNQDYDDDGQTPQSYTSFRKEVAALDGFLFVTPEYNRSMPAALKNALDVGSRPYGQSIWNGKPGALISVSPGGFGGFGANQQLRQPMSFLNILLLQQPEVYIGNVEALLNEDGELVNESTQKFLREFMDAFSWWINVIADSQ